MPSNAGQAITAERKVTEDFIKDNVQAPDGLIIDAPRQVIAAGALFEEADDVVFRRAQNNGTAPIAYIIVGKRPFNPNGTPAALPVPTAANKHGIIAPSTAEDDGFGGVEIFRLTKGLIVIAPLTGGTVKVDTMQYRNPGVIQ